MSTDGRKIRVLVADDHPVYVDGLVAAIERTDDLRLVAKAANGEEALGAITEHRPDVAVLDLKMPRLTARDVLEELSAHEHDTAVLVLTVVIEGEEIHQCLSLGASGYMAKDASRAEILGAIRRIAAGDTVLSDDALNSMAAELKGRRGDNLLSNRESEILGLLADGASAPDIAAHLYLSTATVKSHLHSLYQKLEVSDRAAAVAAGLRRGLIR